MAVSIDNVLIACTLEYGKRQWYHRTWVMDNTYSHRSFDSKVVIGFKVVESVLRLVHENGTNVRFYRTGERGAIILMLDRRLVNRISCLCIDVESKVLFAE